MGDPVPSSAISDATTGGLSVIVITGGSDGDVLTQQADGTYAPETPSSGGSPGGSSGQVQYNAAGAFGGMTAVVYAGSGTHLTVTCQSSTTVALEVRESASQTVSPFTISTSAGTPRILSAPAGKSISFLSGSWFTHYSQVDNSYGDRPSFAISTRSISASTPSTHHLVLNALGDNAKTMLCLGAGSWTGLVQMMTSAAPGVAAIRGCAGSGTNIAGAPLEIASGPSTGNANPSLLKFQGTTVGTSGTTLQTLRDCLHIDGNTTAGETPLLLLDIGKGTLQRVSIGASDSGGTGFKVLRVPN